MVSATPKNAHRIYGPLRVPLCEDIQSVIIVRKRTTGNGEDIWRLALLHYTLSQPRVCPALIYNNRFNPFCQDLLLPC